MQRPRHLEGCSAYPSGFEHREVLEVVGPGDEGQTRVVVRDANVGPGGRSEVDPQPAVSGYRVAADGVADRGAVRDYNATDRAPVGNDVAFPGPDSADHVVRCSLQQPDALFH